MIFVESKWRFHIMNHGEDIFGGQIRNVWSDTEFRPRIFGIPAGAGPLPIVWSRWRELEESPILVGYHLA